VRELAFIPNVIKYSGAIIDRIDGIHRVLHVGASSLQSFQNGSRVRRINGLWDAQVRTVGSSSCGADTHRQSG
jgi:hypothetical protein